MLFLGTAKYPRSESEEMRADKKVVLAAVQQNGTTLEYASEEMRGDKEVVLAAVQQNGNGALKYASAEMRADKEVVLALKAFVLAEVQQEGFILVFASNFAVGITLFCIPLHVPVCV